MHLTDRRTDRQNSHRYDSVCIACSAVKTWYRLQTAGQNCYST